MKKRRTLRALSVLMALVMSFSAVQSLPVAAAQAAENESNTQVQQDKEPEFLPGDLTEKELQTAKLTESDTPEVVDEELIEEKGHVNRLWEQENDLNTIVFQNKNGSKTMYIYAAPVKYKDETGKVKDKKNKLSEQDIEPELAEDYGLTNPENDVRTYFPKKLNKNKGVVLQYGDVKLEVSPLKHHKTQKAQAATLSLESQPQAVVMANEAPGQKKKQNKTDVVEYNKVFGKNTVLRYSATLNGFKEDLILEENIGVNEFSFRVKTNGLSLLKEGEVCYFADPLTGEMVSRVGDILVYDSKDPEVQAQSEVAAESVSYDHHYTVETVEEDQEYILTMVIDEEYLNSPDIVYPVTVDPSFTIDGSRNSDTTIYTNYSKTDWKNGSMFAGNYNKRFPKYDRGTARALVRVPYWYDGLINLQTSQINSVKLDLSDLYPGDPPNTISVYKMNEYWDDLSAVCSDKLWDGYDKNAISTREFKWGNRDYEDDNGVHHYLVDITKAVKDWKDGKTTDNGLMLKAEDESIAARVFGTVDGNYPLNLEVSYGYGDQDGDGIRDDLDVDPQTPYTPAVILLHGRTDNSDGCWGAPNNILPKTNDHFNSALDAYSKGYQDTGTGYLYTARDSQKINLDLKKSYLYTDTTETAIYLARYLGRNGYTQNENIFVFNYPNEDAVIHNGKKLSAYINNIVEYAKNSGDQRLLSYFFKTKDDYNQNHFQIDLIGHSMGGLVSRYYIENMQMDRHVRRLITIDTPHWGSNIADTSCNIDSPLHKLCDHDLRTISRMYGGSESTALDCGLIFNACYKGNYTLTEELRYKGKPGERAISTEYYAIAGLDFASKNHQGPCYEFEIPADIRYNDLESYFYSKNIYNSKLETPDLNADGDNVVSFDSQIGFSKYGTKKIQFNKIYFYLDGDGGNNVLDHYHGKMVHLKSVASRTLSILK